MTVETWVQAGLTAVTGIGAALAGRAARRTRRQERRDDFTVIKDALNERIDGLTQDMGRQQEQLTGQGAAIAWLVTDRRSLVAYIRSAKLEPPAPRPIPPRAQPYLEHLDV
ncbi:hypothetical protein QBA57_28520 [Streptomyces scabiei]|uniref:hypothetical protein n=1 Tax=Streptomyces scabiei TaxID=1930 RepID=UPI001B323BC6|nr:MULTISPECIES: hypothetical protein [Streptomyces]MBP5883187.1 hypothetical protein [Streptomyces sp. LBUM 1487]MDX2626827.1 hypothetical protein [Streptomyces scabiei]MDX3162764.1 hypothetical protein [Streptomyces scabiei]